MKRLSDFGFVPKPQTSQEKRARQSASDTGSGSTESPQPSEVFQPEQPQSPQPQMSSEPQQSLQVPSKFVRIDVGTYSSDRLRRLSDEDRFWLLRNAFRPDISYKYPTKVEYNKQRSFQHNWLVQFPWLCYSESCNGGFCVHCVLFARCSMPLGQLVTCPMSNFTRATVTLQEHSK